MMAKEFKGKKIMELTRLTPEGEIEKVFRYEAITTKGTHFSVDIPESQLVLETAVEIVAARAKQLDALLGA